MWPPDRRQWIVIAATFVGALYCFDFLCELHIGATGDLRELL